MGKYAQLHKAAEYCVKAFVTPRCEKLVLKTKNAELPP